MDSASIKEIERLVQEHQTIKTDEGLYVAQKYAKLRQIDRLPLINVSTLRSLVDYVQNDPQGIGFDGSIACINDDMSVVVLSLPHPEDKIRTKIIAAQSDFRTFQFNTFHNSELFNILLQTMFIFDDAAKSLFTIASKLVIDEGIDVSDDGMTTKVVVRKGMSSASASAIAMPSTIALKPHRIFAECVQPESTFLVRFKGDRDSGAHVGLWETDGGSWKNAAKEIIKQELLELGLEIPIFA